MNLDHAAIATISNKVGQAGGVTAIAGWATASDVAAVLGALAALGGLLVTWHYKRKADRRDAELHAKRMRDEAPE